MKFLPYKLISILGLMFVFANFAFAQTGREEGIKLFQKGDYKGAIKILKEVTKKDSDDTQALYALGFAYYQTDKTKEAQKAFSALTKLKPNDARGYVGMAYVKFSDGNKIYEAQTFASKAIQLDARNADAHYLLGLISYRNGLYNGAYERASNAIKIKPTYAVAYLLRAEALTSSFGQISGTVIKSPTERVELLKEAAVDMEKYISLASDKEDKKENQERLESLKFFAAYYEDPEHQPRNTLEPIAPTDDKSTPFKIISKPRAEYTDSARKKMITGTVRMLVGFPADGTIKYILVVRGLDRDLDEQAVKAAQKIKFEPATKNGQPVSVVKTIEYVFSIY